jgi:hypothetical protein
MIKTVQRHLQHGFADCDRRRNVAKLLSHQFRPRQLHRLRNLFVTYLIQINKDFPIITASPLMDRSHIFKDGERRVRWLLPPCGNESTLNQVQMIEVVLQFLIAGGTL